MNRFALCCVSLGFFILIFCSVSVQAQDMFVTDSSPYVNANGRCSLVEAIDNANADAVTHADCPAGAGADTIYLSRTIRINGSTLFPPDGLSAVGDSGLPEITSDITITGGGIRRTGGTDFRFFAVANTGSLTLDDMTIENGRVVGDCDFSGTPAEGCGGAIVSTGGNITLINATLTNNQAIESTPSDVAAGGAIMLYGGSTLTITESMFTNNTAEYGGAVFVTFGTVDITDSTFTANSSIVSGGAIYQSGSTDTTILGSSFSDNQVTTGGFSFSGGGAIDNAGSNTQLTVVNTTFDNNSAPNGGAINNFNASDANIINATFTGNSATNGGAILNRGSGATINVYSSTITDNTASNGAGISNGGTSDAGIAHIINTTISDNTATGDGGGISTRGTLTLEYAVVDNNNASSDGGGIFVGSLSNQSVTITGSDITNNFAGGQGGGLFYTENPSGTFINLLDVVDSTFDNNEADEGGGIYAARTTVDITRSTISNNEASNIGVGGGGGVYFNSVSVVDITNSTVSGNHARQDGGGVYINNSTTATISNSTIANNTNNSTNGADGLHSLVAIADVVVSDTIIADNGNRNCIDISAFFGVTDGGNNISSDTTCGFADTGSVGIGDGVDPLLNGLADNGGNTETHALQVGSPAIDNSSGTCPATDQRGAGRTNTCDIGAFEGVTDLAEVSIAVDETILYEVSGTIATVTISLDNTGTNAQNVTLTLPLRVTGDATGTGSDYTQSNQNSLAAAQPGQVNPLTLVALAGQIVSDTFTIIVIDDNFVENDEGVDIDARLIGNATFTGNTTLGLTLISDDVEPLDTGGNNNDERDVDPVTDEDASPDIDVFDPAISKLGLMQPGELGVLGEQLRWDVTVSNLGDGDGENVVITDTLRSELRIDDVTTTKGQIDINGQTVTVTIPVLKAGEQVHITITTTSLDGVVVDNTACVDADNRAEHTCATAFPVSSLPNTGQSPAWRDTLVMMMGAIVLLLGMLARFIRPRIQ
jgi:predicted outer membrane repeat protein